MSKIVTKDLIKSLGFEKWEKLEEECFGVVFFLEHSRKLSFKKNSRYNIILNKN